MRARIPAIFVAAVVIAAQGGLAQRTLRVPRPYPTIKSAMAVAGKGDTILVAPGRYVETVQFPQNADSVVLMSSAGPYLTTIDGALSTIPAVTGPATCVIDGFTITNARATGVTGELTIQNNIITLNHSPYSSGGIRVWGNSLIQDNIIERNRGRNGGGIGFPGIRVGLSVLRNLICDNHSDTVGGGIHADSSHLTLIGNRILRNTAKIAGGGIFAQGGSYFQMTDNVIAGNSTPGDGGGIVGEWSTIQFSENTVVSNTAGVRGGGVYTDRLTNWTVQNSIFWGNRANQGPTAWLDHVFTSQKTSMLIDHSIVEGGVLSIVLGPQATLQWGANNLTVDPRLIDFAGGDWHLSAGSPAVDTGKTPPRSGNDVDGNPRVLGKAIDIGADEFGTHLYTVGSARPGTTLWVRAVSSPGRAVLLGLSMTPRIRTVPVLIPGSGMLVLEDPIGVIPLGSTDLRGVTDLKVPLPAALPPVCVFLQALVGVELTRHAPAWVH